MSGPSKALMREKYKPVQGLVWGKNDYRVGLALTSPDVTEPLEKSKVTTLYRAHLFLQLIQDLHNDIIPQL